MSVKIGSTTKDLGQFFAKIIYFVVALKLKLRFDFVLIKVQIHLRGGE